MNGQRPTTRPLQPTVHVFPSPIHACKTYKTYKTYTNIHPSRYQPKRHPVAGEYCVGATYQYCFGPSTFSRVTPPARTRPLSATAALPIYVRSPNLLHSALPLRRWLSYEVSPYRVNINCVDPSYEGLSLLQTRRHNNMARRPSHRTHCTAPTRGKYNSTDNLAHVPGTKYLELQ